MANDLTGDFDVVAEFTIPAANRILAAMHRGSRLPHSWSLRVDNYTHIHIPLGTSATVTGVRSVVDKFGEALTDPGAVSKVSLPARAVSVINVNTDFPVNLPKPAPVNMGSPSIRPDVSGFIGVDRNHLPTPEELERASHLNGVAQLQLGPPTISLGRSDTTINVHTPVMASYTPDPGTFEIPDYLHGEFQVTIKVDEISSSAGKFIVVGPANKTGNASFIPKWVSPAWDSEPDQLTAINKAVANSLTTSFEPSSTPVPASIPILRFKTLPGGPQPALAVMMDIPGGVLAGEVLAAALFGIGTGAPEPSTVNNVFLAEKDDFALAVRSDDIITSFKNAVSNAMPGQLLFTTTTHVEGLWGAASYTMHTYTTITLEEPEVELKPGQIVVTILVHVHFSNDSSFVSSPDDFDFTITQVFGLVLSGGEVSLQPLGNLDIDIPPSVPGAIANPIRTRVTNSFNAAWQSASGSIQAQVGASLSVDNLQGFLKSMMNPAPKPGAQPVEEVDPRLDYTWYEIIPAGIVLHGTLQVPAWPKPHVEFSYRSIPGPGPYPIARGEHSALKSWIPGGTIQEYIWNQQDGPPLRDDHNTFLFHHPTSEPLSRLCLTAKGSRITASGPISYEAVSATSFCSWHMSLYAQAAVAPSRAVFAAPKIALTQRATSGGLEVIGHTSPWAPAGTLPENATNLVVHFPDRQSLANLEVLPRALAESGREDAATGIVVVLDPEQLATVRATPGVVFADDEKAWAHQLKFEKRPATFLIDTSGDVVWQHQGGLTPGELAAGLRAHLGKGGRFLPRVLRPNLRIGQPVPNFLFDAAPGRQLTLRKLAGRPVVLVFWKSSSQASIQTLRDLERAYAKADSRTPILLAINDGDPSDVAQRSSAERNGPALLVADPERDIAVACGINLWPTSVFLDSTGLVTDIRYGRFPVDCCKPPAQAAGD